MKQTTITFIKEGTIESKSVIESKEYGSLHSVRQQQVEVEWFHTQGRRRKVYSTRVVVIS